MKDIHMIWRKLHFSSRNTLCDPEVIRYINIHTLFWACNVKSGEGYKVAEALKSGSYPFLALIVLKDNRMTIVGRYVKITYLLHFGYNFCTQKHKIAVFKTVLHFKLRFFPISIQLNIWNCNKLVWKKLFSFLQNGRCTIFRWFNVTFTNDHRT